MPFIQNSTPPEQPSVEFNVSTFTGGLNNVTSPIELNHDVSPDMRNVYVYDDGVLQSRPGLFKYCTEQLPETCTRFFYFNANISNPDSKPGATLNYLIASSNSAVYAMDLTDTTQLPVKLCDVVRPISGVQYGNSFFFVDGRQYREYKPEYNAETGEFEHSIYDVVKETTGSEGSLYYNNANKEVRYKPSTDEEGFPFKGPNNVKAINNATQIVVHNTRIFFSGVVSNNLAEKNLVYMTDIDNPHYVPTNAYVLPITNDGDYITGMYSFNGVLSIFKRNSVFALYGYTADDANAPFTLKEVTVEVGTNSPRSITQVGNYLYYLGTNGIVYAMYDVRTDVMKMMSTPISNDINLRKYPIQLYPNDWKDAFGILYNQIYFLFIKDKILLYKHGYGWMLWDNINPTAAIVYGDLLLLTNSDNYVFRLTFDVYNIIERLVPVETEENRYSIQRGYVNELTGEKQDAKVYIAPKNIFPNGDFSIDDLSNWDLLSRERTFINSKRTFVVEWNGDWNAKQSISCNITDLLKNQAYNNTKMFDLYLDLEFGHKADADKYLTIEIRFDGTAASALRIGQIALLGSRNGTHRYTIDLSEYNLEGYTTIDLAFSVSAYISGANNYRTEIDNIVLKPRYDISIPNQADDITQDFVKIDNQTLEYIGNDSELISNSEVYVSYLSLPSYNDNGKAYKAYWESKDFDFNVSTKTKQIRTINVVGHTFKWYKSNLTFNVFMDYDKVTSDVNITNQIPLWGAAIFGVNRFIDKNIVRSQPIVVNRRGFVTRFRIESSELDAPFRVYGIHGNAIIRNR